MNNENGQNPQSKEDAALKSMMDDLRETETKDLLIVGSKALSKSLCDPFDYSIRLTTGEKIRYESATIISSDWIHLENAKIDDGFQNDYPPFPRGIDVRISHIVWAKDAPYGS